MQTPGPLLAAGRDCDVFEYSQGLVLRRSRAGRSLAAEARVMEYVRGFGYPVPAVDELSDDGTAMVIERVDGPSMVGALGSRPWTVRALGRALAGLHRRLHEIPAPDWLPAAPCGEPKGVVLHLDLHPLNVVLGRQGPVVIDWTGASSGEGPVDVALAWALMAGGGIPGGRVAAALLSLGRGLLVQSFVGAAADLEATRRVLPAVVEWKCTDPHMSDAEQSAMRRLAAKTGAPLG